MEQEQPAFALLNTQAGGSPSLFGDRAFGDKCLMPRSRIPRIIRSAPPSHFPRYAARSWTVVARRPLGARKKTRYWKMAVLLPIKRRARRLDMGLRIDCVMLARPGAMIERCLQLLKHAGPPCRDDGAARA